MPGGLPTGPRKSLPSWRSTVTASFSQRRASPCLANSARRCTGRRNASRPNSDGRGTGSAAVQNVSRDKPRIGTVFSWLRAVRGWVDVAVAEIPTIAGVEPQNGFIRPLRPPQLTPQVLENRIHSDFVRYLYRDPASTRTCFAIGAFARKNGAKAVVPGGHPRPIRATAGQTVRAQPPRRRQLLGDCTLAVTDRGEYCFPALGRRHRKEHE